MQLLGIPLDHLQTRARSSPTPNAGVFFETQAEKRAEHLIGTLSEPRSIASLITSKHNSIRNLFGTGCKFGTSSNATKSSTEDYAKAVSSFPGTKTELPKTQRWKAAADKWENNEVTAAQDDRPFLETPTPYDFLRERVAAVCEEELVLVVKDQECQVGC